MGRQRRGRLDEGVGPHVRDLEPGDDVDDGRGGGHELAHGRQRGLLEPRGGQGQLARERAEVGVHDGRLGEGDALDRGVDELADEPDVGLDRRGDDVHDSGVVRVDAVKEAGERGAARGADAAGKDPEAIGVEQVGGDAVPPLDLGARRLDAHQRAQELDERDGAAERAADQRAGGAQVEADRCQAVEELLDAGDRADAGCRRHELREARALRADRGSDLGSQRLEVVAADEVDRGERGLERPDELGEVGEPVERAADDGFEIADVREDAVGREPVEVHRGRGVERELRHGDVAEDVADPVDARRQAEAAFAEAGLQVGSERHPVSLGRSGARSEGARRVAGGGGRRARTSTPTRAGRRCRRRSRS